jgi:hypothetical protein
MSRRGFRTAVALLALTFVLATPSVFAAPSRDSSPDSGISRIVRAVKKIVRNLSAAVNDDPGVIYPAPPKP